jgi:hypothetical protein
MRKLMLVFVAGLVMLMSLNMVSAYYTHLEQSVDTSQRWYDIHTKGYDPNPPNRLSFHYGHKSNSYYRDSRTYNYFPEPTIRRSQIHVMRKHVRSFDHKVPTFIVVKKY